MKTHMLTGVHPCKPALRIERASLFPGISFRIWCLVLALATALLSAGPPAVAAQMGRQSGADIPKTDSYDRYWTDSQVGVEVGADFLMLHWKVEDTSFDAATVCPALAVTFGASPALDLRAATSFFKGSDEVDGVDGDILSWQLGVGARYWLSTESDFSPYLQASLFYMLLDSDEVSSLEGTLGAGAEVGIAYRAIDNVLLQLAAGGLTSLIDASGRAGDEDVDVSVAGLTVGVKVAWLF